MRRAVITGVGVVSPFGIGADAFFGGLTRGASCVGAIRSFDASSFPVQVAGEVPVARTDAPWLAAALGGAERDLLLTQAWSSGGHLRDRKAAFAVLAAAEAWRAAGCGAEERGAWLSVALGLERALLEDFAPIFGEGRIAWEREPEAPLPAVRFRSSVDEPARLVREYLDLKGLETLHVSACAAGALAVSHAASLVERGAASVALCGGTDSMVNPLGLGGMSRLGAPSPRNAPDACRPFDRRRDGLVIGEGAAMFVVEEEARARARGAPLLARVLGWGSTQDAWRVTAPRPDGASARVAIERALQRARVSPADVGYINAHGTGTPLNDPAEAQAIRGALGNQAERIPVSSIKGAIGHLMAAAGAIELAACLLPLRQGVLPGTAHLQERDPAIALPVIGPAPMRAEVEIALSNSFGFGGQNCTVVLGRAA